MFLVCESCVPETVNVQSLPDCESIVTLQVPSGKVFVEEIEPKLFNSKSASSTHPSTKSTVSSFFFSPRESWLSEIERRETEIPITKITVEIIRMLDRAT